MSQGIMNFEKEKERKKRKKQPGGFFPRTDMHH
jgi:hypothetical protein